MFPSLDRLRERLLGSASCEEFLVTRYKAPDTHVATWVCAADDSRCTASYGAANASARKLDVCLPQRPNLLHLAKDHASVLRLLDQYEGEMQRNRQRHRLFLNELKAIKHTRPDDRGRVQLLANKFVWWNLVPIGKSVYDGVDGSEEVVEENGGVYFDVQGMESKVLLPFPLPSELENKGDGQRFRYTIGEESSFVSVHETPGVHVKTKDGQSYVRVSRPFLERTDKFYKVEHTLVVRRQLGGPLASQVEAVKDILESDPFIDDKRRALPDDWFVKFPSSERYKQDELLVRVDDGNGHDQSIIDFMIWAHDRFGFEGFQTQGVVDLMGGHARRVGKLNAPEILLVGTPAATVASAWIRNVGEFEDSYLLGIRPREHPEQPTISMQNFLLSEPSFYIKTVFESEGSDVLVRVLRSVLTSIGYEL